MGWLELWSLCRGGAMSPGRLPCAGGVGDQPARLMAIFGLMDSAYALLTEKPSS